MLKSDLNVSSDSGVLLDYGFDNFKKIDVINRNTVVTEQEVKYGDSVKLAVDDNFSAVVLKSSSPITQKVIINPEIRAPIAQGDILGHLEIYQDDIKLGSIELVATNDIERKIHTFWWFWSIITVLAIYVPFRIVVGIRRYKRYKRKIRYVTYMKRYK